MSAAVQRQGLRFLPAAAIVLALLFMLKVAGFGAELSALFGSRTAYAETEAPAPDAAPAEDALEPAAAAPEGEDPAASGPTASEADVMESLAQRREQLDAREREIDMREKVIAAAEKRVEERIAELKAIEQNIETMFGARDDQEEKQLASLVKTYEAMKPADAAEIFNKLDINVTLDVISRIKPAKAAPILAAMKPERAEQVTVELARRYQLPKAAEAAPAPAAPPAAPPAPGG